MHARQRAGVRLHAYGRSGGDGVFMTRTGMLRVGHNQYPLQCPASTCKGHSFCGKPLWRRWSWHVVPASGSASA